MYIYTYNSNNEKRDHEIEREQGGVNEQIWRKEKEELSDVITYSLKNTDT